MYHSLSFEDAGRFELPNKIPLTACPSPQPLKVPKLTETEAATAVLMNLTLEAPIATIVVCFSRLLKCLRSLYGKQCGPRSDCSYRSSLFWVHTIGFFT